MTAITWPKWLPYPISWMRACALLYTLTLLVKSQLPLRHSDSIFAVMIGAWATVPFVFTFFHWAIASAVKPLLTHLPAHPKLDGVRQYLIDRWPGLKRSHWKEGLNAFIISFVAFIISAFVVSYLVPVPSKADAYEYDFYLLRRSMILLKLDIIPIGMMIISAYLYQYDLWARHRRAAKSAAKAKAQEATKKRSPNSNSPPPNPVEQELNQLKATTGMNRMKSVRRSTQPTPEVPQWYVFRSGEAKGPYTRLQLWEVQEITARTKVRRGEAEWQRAGELPELVAYLTQK